MLIDVKITQIVLRKSHKSFCGLYIGGAGHGTSAIVGEV